MIIYAVYILKNNGTVLVSEYYQSESNLPELSLMGSLITSLKGFTSKALQNDMKTIESQGLVFHVRSFGSFSVIVVTNLSKAPTDVIQEIGLSFLKDYGEDLLETETGSKTYDSFQKTLKNIIAFYTFDETNSLMPFRSLSPQEIFDLPAELQQVALTVLSMGEGTIEQIKEEIKVNISNLAERLEKLQKLGYLGKKVTVTNTIFFCAIYSSI